MYTFVTIKNTRISSLCKPLEIQNNNNFFLCKLLRAVTCFLIYAWALSVTVKFYYRFSRIIFESSSAKRAMFFHHNQVEHSPKS